MNCLVSAAMVMTLAGVLVAPTAFAKIATNTIDPLAIVTDNGLHIIVTGPIACTEGERAYLRVTVSQRATAAVAEGRTLITCTGNTQQWEVHASTQGNETFEEGPATAVCSSHNRSWGNDRCASVVGQYHAGRRVKPPIRILAPNGRIERGAPDVAPLMPRR
jgi:hypothetical protein